MRLLFALFPLVFAGRYCPPGSFDVPQQNECLHTEVSPQPFTVANLICSYIGGSLVKVTNAFVNNLVAGQALSQLQGQKAYIGVVKAGNNNWTYVDGTQLTYVNWMAGQPNQENGSCAAMDPVSLQWTTISCQQSLGYFCTIPDLSTPCPNGWTYFYDTDSCYLIHVRIIQTDNANSNRCDASEVVFGLQCTNAAFSWTDGTPVDYKNSETKLCSTQNYVYGMINDPNCNTTQYQHWDEWQTNQPFSRYACKMAAH
ncbi:unnamed protein product, partial [Mesorhabditis belari]|uniref:C-type lectin domain-containing protein n=1 Tax=Mesorhabditis belari TaxID=2138241 RepID=A0AAF3EMI3_9BILA